MNLKGRRSRVEGRKPESPLPILLSPLAGMTLIDCLAYIGLLGIILGLTFSAFYRTSDSSKHLTRNAADIARALNAGERWREDVRGSSATPRFEEEKGVPTLRLSFPTGEVAYAFRDNAVFRQALPNTNWIAVLPAVASSVMFVEPRRHVTCWHWDLELKGRQKVARVRPVFTFEAVQGGIGRASCRERV